MLKWLALAFVIYILYVAVDQAATNNSTNAQAVSDTPKPAKPKPIEPKPPAIPMGDWKTGFYVDEFGDKTTDGYVSITATGTFSNTAIANSPLTAKMFINTGSRDPWFRLYEYAGNNPVKGVYSDSSVNMLNCRVKKGEMQPFTAYFNQYKGADSFRLDKEGQANLRDAIVEETSVKISCYLVEYPTTKYRFDMDFSHFNNAMAKAEGRTTET